MLWGHRQKQTDREQCRWLRSQLLFRRENALISEDCHESKVVLTLKGLFSKNVLFHEECLRAVTSPNPSPTKNVECVQQEQLRRKEGKVYRSYLPILHDLWKFGVLFNCGTSPRLGGLGVGSVLIFKMYLFHESVLAETLQIWSDQNNLEWWLYKFINTVCLHQGWRLIQDFTAACQRRGFQLSEWITSTCRELFSIPEADRAKMWKSSTWTEIDFQQWEHLVCNGVRRWQYYIQCHHQASARHTERDCLSVICSI